jgi:hypothetical protein
MRTITYLLIAIALIGMASAVELSNSNMSQNIFDGFLQEDLAKPTALPPADAWNVSQERVIGGFDYSDVADLTNAFQIGDSLVRAGYLSDGNGHYLDGTKNYIQP